jgi:long-chain acyl-CoA synthetase
MLESSLPEMVRTRAARYGSRTALKVKRFGAYQDISWRDFQAQVEEIALGLLDLGVEPGDRVALLSPNRPEWAMADLAILSVGAATVPIYATLTPEEVAYLLTHSGSQMVFVSDPEMMTKIVGCQDKLGLKVVLFDAPYRVSGPRVWWLGELRGLGRTSGESHRQTLEERRQRISSSTLASIIYTSGTTGIPKGVMLSHGNFLSNCEATRQILSIQEEDLFFSFLPLSHVFERMAGYYFPLFVGAAIAYAEDLDSVPENLLEVQPTLMTGVPRFYEKIQERSLAAAQSASAVKRALFRWALRVGQQRSHNLLAGQPVPPGLALQHRLADHLVFSKLRARMGGRLRFCVSGGAPLSKPVAEFFHAAGILLIEGYGLTETSPVICANRPDRFRFGTVGPPLPGIEVKIADDGEVLTRGPHVMQGYFQNPEATAEAIDADGWFHTGDIGEFGKGHFLTLTDRKKDLIKTSGGKMAAPQALEAKLKSDPFITDCVVLGDRRKYLTALIVPNAAKLSSWLHKKGRISGSPEEMAALPEVKTCLWERVERLNRTLAPFEQIKKIAVLPQPFTQSGGELTPTLKVKRRVVAERYADQIETLYKDSDSPSQGSVA